MIPEKLNSVLDYIRLLTSEGFYGTLALRFDSGRIVLLNLQQSLKPETIEQLASQEQTKLRRIYDTDPQSK